MNLNDLIMYENENTSLDFKSIQYKREQYESMIKDVMSMANADIDGERYIILGVRHMSSGERDVLGIEKSEFVDSATYQQIIFQNIEPKINIDYLPYEYDGKLLGIIKIYDCNDQPYMMKKDSAKLKKGDSFIRKGSQQSKMERRDFDRIYAKIKSKNDFIGKVKLGFDNHKFAKEIELDFIKKPELRSDRDKKEIEDIIQTKKQKERNESLSPHSHINNALSTSIEKIMSSPLFGQTYEQRSIEELENNLLNVKSTYKEDDYYELFELNAHKLNICIFNQGDRYIEDSSIEVKIEKIDGLIIASKIYEKPIYRNPFSLTDISPRALNIIKYPDVKQEGSSLIISQHIGDIKHQITTKAFSESIRIVLTSKAKNQTIKLTCKIFGKNLTEPLVEELNIKVIDLLGE